MVCDSSATEFRRRNKRAMQRKLLPVQLFLYGVFLPAVLFAHPAHNSLRAYILAILLSLTMVVILIWLAILATRRTDEFQRMLLTQAMLWGICGTLSITTFWGLLAFFTNVWELPSLSACPIFLAITMTAKVILYRRNPAADD